MLDKEFLLRLRKKAEAERDKFHAQLNQVVGGIAMLDALLARADMPEDEPEVPLDAKDVSAT